MKKIIISLTLILLFSCQSVQAETPMEITSEQAQLDEEKADADNEGEVGVTVVTGIKVTTGVNETVGVIEATEAKEIIGAVAETEVTSVAEATAAPEVVETVDVDEAVEAKDEIEEVAEATSVIEVSKVAGITEAAEVVEANGIDSVDYKALGVRSVELNSNDPDGVITLLEPHKNDRNNKSVLFYSSLGLAYKSKGRLGDAIAAYKRALELVPDVSAPAIQYNLGIAYYYNNELPESLNCFLNSSVYRSDHPGTKKWIKYIAGKLNVFKVPDTSKLKLVSNQKISVNRKKDDRESRLRMYLTQNGGRIQELSVKDRIYSYGIDSDTERPVDYIIIDSDGDGNFDNVINTKCKFGVPTWAYNPD